MPTPCQNATRNLVLAQQRGLPEPEVLPDDWFIDGTDMFDAKTDEEKAQLKRRLAHAVWLCHHECPVRTVCMSEGLKTSNLPFGVWGGYTSEQRAAIVDHTITNRRRHHRADVGNPFDL